MMDYGLPDGVTLSQTLAVLIPIAVITVALRWLPFAFVRALKGNQFFALLGLMMPVGVMAVLVVYTLFGQASAPGGVPAALSGVAVTLGLHAWKRDSGLSILGGTVAYMALVNLVF
ncbi:branched-chain amino acid transporter permease [Corynebacterium suedekumii]|uniref:AzlD domain-containing protein n=1 Tax=Corynebacterium suedekumii TaxID=3049801 RepID=A0ABY8VPE8_9CORY|nr:AzlD domain-containing protein [Corynebacterium suedekumii]WIM70957.1 AzlD domain-containing protein [Corynebacterium suedekumii]